MGHSLSMAAMTMASERTQKHRQTRHTTSILGKRCLNCMSLDLSFTAMLMKPRTKFILSTNDRWVHSSRFSSAGRASDWRSEGPVFDPRRWHIFTSYWQLLFMHIRQVLTPSQHEDVKTQRETAFDLQTVSSIKCLHILHDRQQILDFCKLANWL